MDRPHVIAWLFDSRHGASTRLLPRWLFLRALGLIYFSAFYSLLFQIKGLIGPEGILPARQYLAAIAQQIGNERYWYAPSLYWISASSTALLAITWIGLAASVAAFCNLWPRLSLFVCFVCFLSFVAASQVFSGYQSDGMLLEAGFLALFFAPDFAAAAFLAVGFVVFLGADFRGLFLASDSLGTLPRAARVLAASASLSSASNSVGVSCRADLRSRSIS